MSEPTIEPGIVILKTKAERSAEREREYLDAAHAEAVSMLERALEMARGNRMAGVAISFVYEDGAYGRIIPTIASNMAGLIGAVGTTHHDLILGTFDADEEF